MIDIHSHILPAIDDGAKDLKMSLIMAKMASLSGTQEMIATPHFCFRYNDKSDIEYLKKTYYAFVEQLVINKIPLKLYLGMEILYTEELLEFIENEQLYGLNRTNYLLIEFDYLDSPDYLVSALAKIKAYGYRPILAHPERYRAVWQHFEILECLVNEGILCQCNTGSLFGHFGLHAKETVQKMFEYGFVHFIGSDCHGIMERNPEIIDAYDHVCNFYGLKVANKIFKKNPTKIISGGIINEI